MVQVVIHLLLPGTIVVAIMMFLLWLLHLRLNNAGVVDPGWAAGIAILSVIYATFGPGYALRRWVASGMALIWGLRLAVHLARRLAGQPEEGRYQQLRKEWGGGNPKTRFLFFFEFQALLDVILSLPFLLAALNPSPTLHYLEYAAIALWIVAQSGEALADAQLAAFKRDPASRGTVCQRGLWNYSRHPNFFFEWLIWVAWALFALASPYGWLAMICPALMFYFLFRVTGIPMTEAQALRSRGEAYRRYQQTTSAFVPWFKKSAP
jgi:steroid 5-alpha reductase family enzyme